MHGLLICPWHTDSARGSRKGTATPGGWYAATSPTWDLMLELGSGRRPGGCDEPDVALGAVGILYSSLKMLSPKTAFAFFIKHNELKKK